MIKGHYFRAFRVEMIDKACWYHLKFWELNGGFDFNEWECPLFLRAWTLGQPTLYVVVHRRLDLVDRRWHLVVCYFVMSMRVPFTSERKKSVRVKMS